MVCAWHSNHSILTQGHPITHQHVTGTMKNKSEGDDDEKDDEDDQNSDGDNDADICVRAVAGVSSPLVHRTMTQCR